MTPQQPTGIPQWLEQFLNSQGGMQGLLYQYGGIRGLLDLIQQQSLQQSQPRPPRPRDRDDWRALLQAHQPPPPPAWQPSPDWNRNITAAGPAPPPATFGGLGYTPTNAGRVGTDPYGAINAAQSPGGPGNPSIAVTPEEMRQIQAASTLKGQELLNALPARFQPTGVTDAMRNASNNAGAALQAAMQAGTVTPEISKAAHDAFNAVQAGTYGPMWTKIGPILEPTSTTGGAPPGNLAYAFHIPQPPRPAWSPKTKYDLAAQYGYAQRSPMGAHGHLPGDQGIDYAKIQQTLKNMGWEQSSGQQNWNQRLSAVNPNTGKPWTDKQTQLFADLQASIAPRKQNVPAEVKPPSLPRPPDPFIGLQQAINRDAYVNETLGGGFYGGLIPEEDAINTWGDRHTGGPHDPHFPTPQLAMNPLPGESRYDTYAGWASDQGAAFGTAPWAVDSPWGHAQGFDNPRLYQQPPPPPTAWQPTPQFGNSNWGGTQGWGNTSRNGQNNGFGGTSTSSTQQQPMTFGASPWDNPWGMR